MKSNQEWVDEYAKLREENNMVNSISKLIDMVKAEFAAHPPAPAGMEEAVSSIAPTDLRIKEKAEEFLNEYASDFPPGNATCFAAGAKWMKDILINK